MSEFDIDVDVDEIGMPEEGATAEAGADPELVRCEACGKMVKVKKDGGLYKHECEPVVDVKINTTAEAVVSADPKADWVDIFIDEVEGLANYEVVGVNGTMYRIKRGEIVSVPPAVVGVLRDSIATKIVQTRHPLTGEMQEERRDYSAIPWRKV